MKNPIILSLVFIFIFGFSLQNCTTAQAAEDENLQNIKNSSDEIIFYSNGSTFSPVIVLQATAEVLWTWEDNTTSNSLTPTKNYESAQLRPNRLKVTPWSAVRRINIGYNAGDDGSRSIEFVNDQKVSMIENLSLVAPYLKEWCSSFNQLTSLDFSNFVNIETIECFISVSLRNVNLTNTPKLKRVCFENNNILNLDLSSSPILEDLRGANNDFNTITFSNQTDNVWHICVHHNILSNKYFFSNMMRFPNVADLLIDYTFQEGSLIISKTNSTRVVDIRAYGNKYSLLDLRGSLKNTAAMGTVELQNNALTTVDITGCIQIKELNLSNNKLESLTIDQILKQVDDFGTNNGTIDLRLNQPPSYTGLIYKSNLESRGWIVQTDLNIPIQSISITSSSGNTISTDNGTLQLSETVLPTNATSKSVNWSLVNVTGMASINSSGLITAEKNGTVKAVATATDGSGIKGELLITISNQVIPIQTITVSSSDGSQTINSDDGKLQMTTAIFPTDATYKSVIWSVFNLTGRAAISDAGILTAERNGTVLAIAWANDASGIKGELQITISNQVIPVESITISSSGGTTITSDNGTLQLTTSALPTDATNKSVSWSVVNISGMATINTSGLITAERNGTVKAVATATDGSGITGEIQITISNQVIPVEIIMISSSDGTTITSDNGTLQLTAAAFPTDATNKSVSWSVMNISGIATINNSGLITAERNGTVKAFATATDGSGINGEIQITISNQVIPVKSITISSSDGTTITSDNGTLPLSAYVLPADATNKSVSWSVVNITGMASISASGIITAQKNGTIKAVATATDGSGIKGEFQITISNQLIPVESISVSSASGTTTISSDNGTLQLSAAALPTDASNKSVNWSVVNVSGMASINTSGLITAESNGTVKAVAMATDGSGINGELQITISNQHVLVESILIHDILKNDTIKGIGTDLTLSAIISPLNATIKDIDWSVENITGKAIISMNGLLTTVSPGIIKVIAKSKDESKSSVYKEYKIVFPVGINTQIELPGIKIFPNPTSGIVKIRIDQIASNGTYIEVRNHIGQTIEIIASFDNDIECSLHNYASGIYFITISTNRIVSTYKIIKE